MITTDRCRELETINNIIFGVKILFSCLYDLPCNGSGIYNCQKNLEPIQLCYRCNHV